MGFHGTIKWNYLGQTVHFYQESSFGNSPNDHHLPSSYLVSYVNLKITWHFSTVNPPIYVVCGDRSVLLHYQISILHGATRMPFVLLKQFIVYIVSYLQKMAPSLLTKPLKKNAKIALKKSQHLLSPSSSMYQSFQSIKLSYILFSFKLLFTTLRRHYKYLQYYNKLYLHMQLTLKQNSSTLLLQKVSSFLFLVGYLRKEKSHPMLVFCFL